MHKMLIVGIVALSFLGCNTEKPTKLSSDYEVVGDTITIAESSLIIKKLENAEISTSSYLFELATSGTVTAIPNNYALIAAPFAGRITRSFVRLGQEVDRNEPVFEISSPTYYETGKAYYQAKEEMDLASKNLNRQRDLLNKGVGVQKDFEEADVNYSIKRKDFENALASLKVFQVDTADLVLGQPLIVRSPIKGKIIENNIVIGQYLKEDSDPVATVAELKKVWVTGQVKEKDIRFINDTAHVEIQLVAFPEKVIIGRIYYINSVIDEDTRSIQVLIECDNKDKLMKPGMYATATFSHNIDHSIVIPSTAIFQMNDASYVFLHIGENKYLKKEIVTFSEDNDLVIVESGLNPGDQIIVNGGYYLLTEK